MHNDDYETNRLEGIRGLFDSHLSELAMMADLVEQSELKTGRRSEGVFFSSVTFIRKSVQGFGLMLASLVLHLAMGVNRIS